MGSLNGVPWWVVGMCALAIGMIAFALAGFWIMGNAETNLDDGDPNNPYNNEKRNRRRFRDG
jgi:hypothetical protein